MFILYDKRVRIWQRNFHNEKIEVETRRFSKFEKKWNSIVRKKHGLKSYKSWEMCKINLLMIFKKWI